MLDIRYHVSSLVAVFLALALGILLGSVIVDKGIMAEQQKALIDSVRTDVKQVQDENRLLKKEADEAQKLQNELIPLVVRERLSGKNIVFISSHPMSDGLKDFLSGLVKKAGARSYLISVSSDLGFGDSEIKKRLSAFFPEENLSDEDLKSRVIERFAIELATSSDKAFIQELTTLGIIKMEGNGNLPANGFVFVGADLSNFDPKLIDVPLINQLKSFGLSLVGVETEDISNSCIPIYMSAKISTVDNVDTIPGEVSLVYALCGVKGNFGTKPTAENLLPITVSE
ncbi:MAG TPA: hypothetical protein ENN38_03380 [Actinobacteria bacterium]|nr:hypothetical protein [Actinomycetota bacterium]